MRISILTLFLALVVAVAAPLTFAEEAIEQQVSEQEEVMGPHALTETTETVADDANTVIEEQVVEMKGHCGRGRPCG